MILKQLRMEKFSNKMKYHEFVKKHDLGLVEPYYGYLLYLYKLHTIPVSYSTFAGKVRQVGYNKAILFYK